MENIYEKCVVKPKDIKDNIITLLAVFGAIGISVLAFLIEFFRPYLFAVILVVIYIAYRLVFDRNIEFEYILAGNSISMDKIFNKKRRKRMLNCDLTDFSIVAPVTSGYYEEYKDNVAKTIVAVSGDKKELEYFGVLEYEKKRTMLVFEADDKALGHIKKQIERRLKS